MFVFSSCEDEMKDEYNQIKTDLEKLKEEKQTSEEENAKYKAELEEAKNLNAKLSEEKLAFAKKTQAVRMDKFVNTYVRFFLYDGLMWVQEDECSSKNIYEDGSLKSTIVYYVNHEELTRNDYNYFDKVSKTITHTLDENGLLLESKGNDFTIIWNWNEDNTVTLKINQFIENKSYELISDENLNIVKFTQNDGLGFPLYVSVSKYNEAGLLLSDERLADNGEVREGRYFVYDANNNMTKATLKTSYSDKDKFYDMTYDEKNRLTKVYTSCDWEKGYELENTFSYDNGYTERFSNLTLKKTEETKYTDITKKDKVSRKLYKEEDNNITNYTYKNGYLTDKIETKDYEDGTSIKWAYVITRDENQLVTTYDYKCHRYDTDKNETLVQRKLYYDVIQDAAKDTKEYLSETSYKEYKKKVWEIVEGEYKVIKHSHVINKIDEGGYWRLSVKTDLEK